MSTTNQPKQQRRVSLTMQLERRQRTKRTKGVLTKLDDDVSTATTCTEMLSEFGSLHGPTEIIERISPTRKRVQFNESQNTSYDNKQLCFEECQELLWYSNVDFKDFKSSTYAIAKDFLRKHPKGERDPYSYQGILSSTFSACCRCKDEREGSVVPEPTENLLNRYMKYWTDLVGLERYLVRKINADKNLRRRMVRDAVLNVQLQNNQSPDSSRPWGQQGMEIMRAASMEASRPSRLLAMQIARSHAASAESWR
jgi:hypothetical protein